MSPVADRQRKGAYRDARHAVRSSDERGFTLVEVLIAGAIIAIMGLIGLTAAKAVAGMTQTIYTAGRDAAAIDSQITQMRNDAASAFAVFVPAQDMNGATNGGPAGAHEVDFYARGDAGQDILWRYFYDATQQTLARFDYDAAGTNGVRDPATGRIDAAAHYPELRAVTAFSARAVGADELVTPAQDRYAGIAVLLAHTPQAYAVRYDRPDLTIPAAAGGNGVVVVTLGNAAAARMVHLAIGALPSGFTVTAFPVWHAIVYRVDQTHRYWGGVAGKSSVFINARVEVSYDNWKHSRVPWCEFNILGNPSGLDGKNDPHRDYTPNEPVEQAETLLNQCRAVNPTPPPPGPGNPPDASVTSQLPPVSTPPPCWINPGPAGRCWPTDAPPNWTPPSPLPLDTPPAQWCSTHAQSVACTAAPPRITPQ